MGSPEKSSIHTAYPPITRKGNLREESVGCVSPDSRLTRAIPGSLALKCHPAVHQMGLARDVACLLGAQKDRERCYLVGSAQPAHGLTLDEGPLDFGQGFPCRL